MYDIKNPLTQFPSKGQRRHDEITRKNCACGVQAKRYNGAEAPWLEVACAENPIGPLSALRQGLEPIPQADKPDF
jgi:hypothetical protein